METMLKAVSDLNLIRVESNKRLFREAYLSKKEQEKIVEDDIKYFAEVIRRNEEHLKFLKEEIGLWEKRNNILRYCLAQAKKGYK